jgi:hypothetical protein
VFVDNLKILNRELVFSRLYICKDCHGCRPLKSEKKFGVRSFLVKCLYVLKI